MATPHDIDEDGFQDTAVLDQEAEEETVPVEVVPEDDVVDYYGAEEAAVPIDIDAEESAPVDIDVGEADADQAVFNS